MSTIPASVSKPVALNCKRRLTRKRLTRISSRYILALGSTFSQNLHAFWPLELSKHVRDIVQTNTLYDKVFA